MNEYIKEKIEIGRTDGSDIMLISSKSRKYICKIQVQQTGGGAIAKSMEPIRIANAERLVKCWNEHKELKAKADCHDDLVAIKKIIQDKSDKLDARIADGKHNDAWPNPDYIKDTDWAGMIGERLVYHHVLRLFDAALAKAK